MIPKIIHYCWFGRGPLPDLAKKCILSWKEYCPDYQIIQWNEDNFDIDCCDYVREAYENKKYAFVSDYVRLWALVKYGGVYMDTDVEVKKNLDCFLDHQAFSGFENDTKIQTAIMACEKEYTLFEELLKYYQERHFIDESGKIDTKTNVLIISEIMLKLGFVPNGNYQEINGFVIYPREYFCPLDDATGIMCDTDNTATIHWFNKSWIPPYKRIRSRITRVIHRWFGVDALKIFRKK